MPKAYRFFKYFPALPEIEYAGRHVGEIDFLIFVVLVHEIATENYFPDGGRSPLLSGFLILVKIGVHFVDHEVFIPFLF